MSTRLSIDAPSNRLDPSQAQSSNRSQRASSTRSVEQDNGPARVPQSIRNKMQLLESGKSSKLWRVLKNVGAGLVGAGIAFALASNPVGWGVTAALIGGGAIALAVGTGMSLRADLAKADVEAFKASVAGNGPVTEKASAGRRAWTVIKNVTESVAFGFAGFFAGAGVGAAFHPGAFHGLLGASQTVSSKEMVNQIALTGIYGGGALGLSAPGLYFDHRRNKDNPELRYQMNISERLPTYNGQVKHQVPKKAGMYPFFSSHRKNAEKAARRSPDERAQVQAQGPIARHMQQVSGNPPTHRPNGTQLQPRADNRHVRMSDEQLLAAMSGQKEDWVNKHVRSSGYAVKRIPTEKPLFSGGPPKISDIRQNHRRCDCYLLGGLAGALMRDGGWSKIEDIMQDNGDGTVTVRLPAEDVTVQKTRIVTEDGYDAFNSGEDWVNLLEKAIAVSSLTRENPDQRKFDQNKYADGLLHLNHLMGPPNRNAGLPENLMLSNISGDYRYTDDKEEWQGIIEDSLSKDLPVSFETRDENYKQKKRRRITPDHTYAVVGTATRNGKRGYMVYDPYGASVGPQPNGNPGNNNVTFDRAQRGNNPLFFVSVDEAKFLFDRLNHSHQGVPPRRQSNDSSMLQV